MVLGLVLLMVSMLLFVATWWHARGHRAEVMRLVGELDHRAATRRLEHLKEVKELNDAFRKGRMLLNRRQQAPADLFPLHGEIKFQNYEPNDRHAIVTLLNEKAPFRYWMGALSLMQSLRDVRTRVPNLVILLVMPSERAQLIQPVMAALERLGVEIIRIESIDTPEHVYIPGTWSNRLPPLQGYIPADPEQRMPSTNWLSGD